MTYRLKFRQHILGIQEKEKFIFVQTAARFGVGIASLIRWSKKIHPLTKRNKPVTKIDIGALEKYLLDYPDDYQNGGLSPNESERLFHIQSGCVAKMT